MQYILVLYNNSLTLLFNLQLKSATKVVSENMNNTTKKWFHFLCLHKPEGFLNQHVLYAALLFNTHKPHCLTDYCEVVESQISYPNWEKSFLAYRNAPILLFRQNVLKLNTKLMCSRIMVLSDSYN